MEGQDKLRSFYDKIKSNPNVTGLPDDYEVFKSALSDTNKAKGFYDTLKKGGVIQGLPDDFSGFSTILPNPDENTEETDTGKKKGFWDTYAGDLVEKAGAGAVTFGGSMYSALDHVNNSVMKPWTLTERKSSLDREKYPELAKTLDELGVPESERGLTNGKSKLKVWAENAHDDAGNFRERAVRNGGKNYGELWKEGDYAGAVGDMFLQASESFIPSALGMMGGIGAASKAASLAGYGANAAKIVSAGQLAGKGIAGTIANGMSAGQKMTTLSSGLIGASAGVKKYDDLDRMPETKDLPEFEKIVNATSTFVFEAASEFLGDITVGKWLHGLYSKVGKRQAEQMVRNGVAGWATKQFKKAGVLVPPIVEGAEEVASQIAGNVTDFCTGVTDEFVLMDGVQDAFIYGAAGGAQFSMVGVPGMTKHRYDKYRAKSDYRKAREVLGQVFPDSNVDAFEEGFSGVSQTDQEEILGNMARNPELSDIQKKSAFDFVSKANVYRNYQTPEAKAKDKAYRLFEDKINKKTGNVIEARDLDDNPVYVIDETDKGSLVQYRGGTPKFIPTSELTIEKESDIDSYVNNYIAHFNAQQQFNIENGDGVIYTDENGQKKTGVVADAFSSTDRVFMEDGREVAKDNIIAKHGIEEINDGLNRTGHQETVTESQGTETDQERGVVEESVQIPQTKEGRPDYNAMLESDPELFASEWEKRSTPESTRAALERQSGNIGRKVESLLKNLEKESDFNKIADIEDEVKVFSDRKAKIDDLIAGRYALREEPVAAQQAEELLNTDKQGIEPDQQVDIKPVGRGFFGDIYDQFKGRANEAINFLLQKKEGEAIGALHHQQVGDIDLVWGNEKTGLMKIARKHPEVLSNLQEEVDKMGVVSSSDNRIVLESPTHKAVVSKNVFDEADKQWLLTAYEKKKNAIISDSSIDIESEPEGKQNGTAPLQNNSVSSESKDTEVPGEKQEGMFVSESDFNIGDLDFDNNIYVIHQTNGSSAESIAGSGLRTKNGLNGTSLFGSRESIQDALQMMREGRGHRGSDQLVVLRFPRSEFENVRNLDDISYGLVDKGFGIDVVPPQYIERIVGVNKGGVNRDSGMQEQAEGIREYSGGVASEFATDLNGSPVVVEYNKNGELHEDVADAYVFSKAINEAKQKAISSGVNKISYIKIGGERVIESYVPNPTKDKWTKAQAPFVWVKEASNEDAKEENDVDDREIRYRGGSPEDVNERFNRELDSLTEENANGKVFHLGMPSKSLLSVGIPNKPFRLYGNKLLKKAKKHGFTPTDIKNLPHALENPIAVFNGNHRSSYAILTELEIRNNKVLVSVETNKDGEIDFNLVSSVFGKSSRSIVNWINSDKLRFSDKEKTLSYLSTSALNADATNNSELSSATNIAQNFVNPTLEEGEISAEIDNMSDALGVRVHEVRSREDLPEGMSRGMKGGKYPGLFDPKSGKVYVVLNEIEDVADAQATVLHEVIGHKGIRGLFGERLPEFCERVLASLPEGKRIKLLEKYEGNRHLAAEEYVAGFAEEYSDPSGWEKVKAIVKEFLRDLTGIDLKLSDNDLKYILWKAKNGLKEGDGMLEVVKKISEDRVIRTTLFRESRIRNNYDGSIDEHMADLTKAKVGGALKSFACKINDAYIDNMSSVKKLQDDIEAETGKPLPEHVNVYMFQNTVSSRNMRECEIFNDEYLKPITSIIRGLSGRGLYRRTLENYLIIKHGLEERNPYMNKKYGTNEKDYSGLEAIRKETGIDDFTGFIKNIEDRHDMNPLWDAINRATEISLKKWYSSGMMTKENYAEVRGMYKYYIPLRGFDETTAEDTYDYFTGSGSPFNNPLKEAKGRRSRAENPIAHIVSMAQSSIVGGNNNLMKLYFLRLAQMYPSAKLSVSREWFEQIGEKDGKPVYESVLPEYDDDMDVYQQNVKDFEIRMKELESAGKAFPSKGKLDVGMHISPQHANEHMVKMRLNGEDYAVYVHGDPLIAQSINGLNQVDEVAKYWLVKGWDWVRRAMTANITTRNIGFIGSNLKRDTRWATETLLVKEGAAYAKDFISGVPDASGALFRFLRGKVDLKNNTDKMLQEFLLNGGETGYTALHNIDKYKKMVKRMSGTSVLDRTHRGYVKFVDTFSSANRWAEDLTRFSTYMASRKAGRSVLRSVYDAKEVTVNFNRKGSGKMGANELKRIFFFFNASLQSMKNMGLMTKDHPYATAALITERVAMGMFMSIITRAFWGMLGDDEDDVEEEYNGLPDHVRKNNSCYYLGKGRGFITMPLPIEDRAFYGMGDALMRYMNGRIDGYEASSEILSGLLDILPLNPVGGYSSIWPDVTRPLEEAYYTNQTFSGMPVSKTNPFNKYRPEFRRVYKNAGKVPVWVSERLNEQTGGDVVKRGGFDKAMSKLSDKFGTNVNLSNPAAFEHVVEGYLGGAYKTYMQAGKSIGAAFDPERDVEARGIPVLNRFYNAGGKYGEKQRVNEKYFDLIDEMQESMGWMNEYKKEAAARAGKGDVLEMILPASRLPADIRYRRLYEIKKVHDKVMNLYEYLNGAKTSQMEKFLQDKIFELKRGALDKIKKLEAVKE